MMHCKNLLYYNVKGCAVVRLVLLDMILSNVSENVFDSFLALLLESESMQTISLKKCMLNERAKDKQVLPITT